MLLLNMKLCSTETHLRRNRILEQQSRPCARAHVCTRGIMNQLYLKWSVIWNTLRANCSGSQLNRNTARRENERNMEVERLIKCRRNSKWRWRVGSGGAPQDRAWWRARGGVAWSKPHRWMAKLNVSLVGLFLDVQKGFYNTPEDNQEF